MITTYSYREQPSNKRQMGFAAEQAVRQWLEEKNWCCLATNFRIREAEVDLIMLQNRTLVLVEVKQVRGYEIGTGATRVDARKIRRICRAGAAFRYQWPSRHPDAQSPPWSHWRIDIVEAAIQKMRTCRPLTRDAVPTPAAENYTFLHIENITG